MPTLACDQMSKTRWNSRCCGHVVREGVNVKEWRGTRSGRERGGCTWKYGRGEKWENRARGGGEWESKIEELPPRHSSILPLWWEHISPVLWPSSLSHTQSLLHSLCLSLLQFLSFFLAASLLRFPPLSLFIQSIVSHLHVYVCQCTSHSAVNASAQPCL